ncbi:ABC transporter substrate-binding protein [Paenibacillus hemerocallicola]|nr:extracellular solute-binding protein [Paenibacillus hemerocallicola]
MNNRWRKRIEPAWPAAKKRAHSMAGVPVAILALALLASACGGGSVKDGESKGTKAVDEPAPPAAAAKPKEPIELVVKDSIFGWTNEAFVTNYATAIEKKFPHIKLKFVDYASSKLPEMVASKQQIDIVLASLNNFYAALLDTGLKYDITPEIKKFKYDLNRLDPGTVALAKQLADGGMYGLPIVGSPTAITYNKDLFDKFGVSYPKDDMTWEQFIDLTKRMSRVEGGVQYRGSLLFTNFTILRNPLSLGFIDPATDKAVVNTDKWKNFFDQFANLYRVPGNQTDKSLFSGTPGLNTFVKDQNVAMISMVSGTNVKGVWVDAGMNVDYVQFPTFKEAPGMGPQPYPTYFYVSSTSKYKDEVFEVLTYLTSDEYQMEASKLGNITVLNNKSIQAALASSLPEFKGKNISAFIPKQVAPPAYQTKYDSVVRGFMDAAFKDVATGLKDINTALREAEEGANKAIAESKAK